MKVSHNFSKPYENERITRNFAAIIADELEERTDNGENILDYNLDISFGENRWEYSIDDYSPCGEKISKILSTKDENQDIEYEDLVDRIEEYINDQLLERIMF